MTQRRRLQISAVIVIASGIPIVLGVLFVRVGLQRADQIASAVGLFLGLAGLALNVITARVAIQDRNKSTGTTPPNAADSTPVVDRGKSPAEIDARRVPQVSRKGNFALNGQFNGPVTIQAGGVGHGQRVIWPAVAVAALIAVAAAFYPKLLPADEPSAGARTAPRTTAATPSGPTTPVSSAPSGDSWSADLTPKQAELQTQNDPGYESRGHSQASVGLYGAVVGQAGVFESDNALTANFSYLGGWDPKDNRLEAWPSADAVGPAKCAALNGHEPVGVLAAPKDIYCYISADGNTVAAFRVIEISPVTREVEIDAWVWTRK